MTIAPTSPSTAPIIGPPPGRDGLYVRLYVRLETKSFILLMFWRKGWDSNPRYPCGHAGFQDRCLKPLGHPSKPGIAVA